MRFFLSTIFFALLLSAFCIGIVSCSKRPHVQKVRSWMADNGKIKVLSTITQVGDLVEEIGGDRIDHWVLMQGNLDPHSYELVKGDDEKFTRAEIVFYNGLGLEHGASLAASLQNHPSSISLGAFVQEKFPEKILKKNKRIDPHIWMDVSLWKQTIEPIVKTLSEKDPKGKAFYEERGRVLEKKMDQIHQEMFSRLQKVPSEKRYLVTSHDAFHYFTRSYLADPEEGESWTERFAAPEGLAPDGQLNPTDIEGIINYLRGHQISVLFPESNVSQDSIKKIVSAGKELGLIVSICSDALYGDAMNDAERQAYFASMLHNAEVIARHLEE